MKYLILILLSPIILLGQSLSVFDIDTTNFPTIKAKFYAFDAGGNQILNLSPSDFEVTEDGTKRNVTFVSCPAPKPPVPISSVLTIDVSGSMSGAGLGYAKEAAKAWVQALPLGQSECAISSFDQSNYLNQDFTTDKSKLLIAINNLQAMGGTDYDAALINPLAGGLLITKNAKYKRVIVFLTDGQADEPRTSEIIANAQQQNVTIYTVTLGMNCPLSLKSISTQTGGQWFENITTAEQAREIYLRILKIAQGGEPCDIEWESGISCDAGITNVELRITNLGINAKASYSPPNRFVAKLEFNTLYFYFKNPKLGERVEQIITVTARNSDFNVSNITLNNNKYTVSPNSFTLKKDENKELTISYTATDSGYTYCKLDFQTDNCSAEYYLSAGYIGVPSSQKTLEITKPVAGDIFFVGADTIITWKGIAENDTVSLEYSIDNGATWKMIEPKATGLKYYWKNIPKPASQNCKIRAKQEDGSLKQADSTGLQFTLIGHTNYVNYISWSPDGSRVATASSDGAGIIWNTASGNQVHTLAEHTGWVNHISWSPDGSRVATASYDNTGIIWDAKTGNKLHTLTGHTNAIRHISWSPDGNRVATASDDGTGIIWNAATGSMIHTLTGHTNRVNPISWSPDGNKVATASYDNTGIIWDASTGNKLHTLTGHTSWVTHISWSPDGSRVATASGDNTGMIWDAVTGNKLHTLIGHTASYVYHISWSPDGSRVATSSRDKKGIIWDATTGNGLQTLTGHTSYVFHISWSPDGSKVATASGDDTGIIWDAMTGNKLHALSGHTGSVSHISWSPDGSKVATASGDTRAKIWEIENPAFIIQEDESEIFSIVAPQATSNDIDMGKVIVNNKKDSVITDFISNSVTWEFRVDSIYFRGADASAFSLLSGHPVYEVEAGKNHFAEFRFAPTQVRNYQAEIVIITQSDTLIQNIIGEGVKEDIAVYSDIIDFGIRGVSDYKDTTMTLITNKSKNPIDISAISMLGPDKYQFEIINGNENLPHTLQSGDSLVLTLRFNPKYMGRTSGQVGFFFNASGSPAIAQLFGAGIGAKISASFDSAFAGDYVEIKVKLDNNNITKFAELIGSFDGVFRVENSILTPYNHSDLSFLQNDSTYIQFKGIVTANDSILTKVRMKAGLGRVEQTTIDFEKISWYDTKGDIIEYDSEFSSGNFKLLGICKEGGTRLFNPEGQVALSKIAPNPTTGDFELKINLIEKGQTEIYMTNTTGMKIKEIFTGNITELGESSFKINAQDIASGMYYIVLQTPTVRKVEKIIIEK